MSDEAQTSETAESYRDLVQFMVDSLVDDGVESNVDIDEDDESIELNIFVPDEERGQVIGRRGRIARAMRHVLTLTNIDVDKDVRLDIVD